MQAMNCLFIWIFRTFSIPLAKYCQRKRSPTKNWNPKIAEVESRHPVLLEFGPNLFAWGMYLICPGHLNSECAGSTCVRCGWSTMWDEIWWRWVGERIQGNVVFSSRAGVTEAYRFWKSTQKIKASQKRVSW